MYYVFINTIEGIKESLKERYLRIINKWNYLWVNGYKTGAEWAYMLFSDKLLKIGRE